MAAFRVEILSPSKIIVKDYPADSIEINTEMGQIGVLPKHMNLLSALAPGVATLQDGDKKKHVFISTGVLRVFEDKITILTSVAEPVEEIDTERAKRALAKATEKLKDNLLYQGEVIKYRRKLERAEARLKAALLAHPN